MAVIFPFGEGRTEGIVFRFLMENYFSWTRDNFQEFRPVGGKNNFRREILTMVRSDLEARRDEVSVLIFRDLDEGEQIANVCQAFQNIVESLLALWKLQPQMQQVAPHHIYKWEVQANAQQPGFRFILHLADNTSLNLPVSLRNHTTDGYILRLGLADQVLSRFAQDSGVNSDFDSLHELITNAIPGTISQRGIVFDEDKDYLAAYLVATRFWVVRRTEEQTRLVRIILDRAWRYSSEHFDRVFESWKLAIQEVLQ